MVTLLNLDRCFGDGRWGSPKEKEALRLVGTGTLRRELEGGAGCDKQGLGLLLFFLSSILERVQAWLPKGGSALRE